MDPKTIPLDHPGVNDAWDLDTLIYLMAGLRRSFGIGWPHVTTLTFEVLLRTAGPDLMEDPANGRPVLAKWVYARVSELITSLDLAEDNHP